MLFKNKDAGKGSLQKCKWRITFGSLKNFTHCIRCDLEPCIKAKNHLGIFIFKTLCSSMLWWVGMNFKLNNSISKLFTVWMLKAWLWAQTEMPELVSYGKYPQSPKKTKNKKKKKKTKTRHRQGHKKRKKNKKTPVGTLIFSYECGEASCCCQA